MSSLAEEAVAEHMALMAYEAHVGETLAEAAAPRSAGPTPSGQVASGGGGLTEEAAGPAGELGSASGTDVATRKRKRARQPKSARLPDLESLEAEPRPTLEFLKQFAAAKLCRELKRRGVASSAASLAGDAKVDELARRLHVMWQLTARGDGQHACGVPKSRVACLKGARH